MYLVKNLSNSKIASLKYQCVVNLVLTAVQKETINRGEFIDLNYLLNKYNENWKLNLDTKILSKIDSPHINYGGILIKGDKVINV